VKEFLAAMSKIFEIIVFTAASRDYAEAVVTYLDPEQKVIQAIIDRSYCTNSGSGVWIKDLRIIQNRELNDMVIVDNYVHSFAYQLENGIPILEWHDDKNDRELKFLQEYLEKLAECDNIAEFNRKNLKLMEFSRVALKELIED